MTPFRLPELRALAAALCLVAPAAAAPPTLTHLFPAGARRGTTVEVRAAGTFGSWPVRAWVGGKGVEMTAGKERGKLTATVAADAVPGTYWVRLFDNEGASSLRPFLVGTLPEVAEREPNDDWHKPQLLSTSAVVVNGRLQKSGDVDCFAVPLRRGQTLVAALEANRTLAAPMDGVMQVVSPDGFVLEHNDDYRGLDSQVVFAVPRDGTYIVRVFAFPATPDASIQFAGGETYIYRLTLTTGGFADHAFPLAVARSGREVPELAGWNLTAATRKPTLVRGEDPDAATLFHPEVANAVGIRLEPHPCVVRASADPQIVVPPVTVSGRIEGEGNGHAYSFAAKKGQTLSFQVEARGLGFPLAPVLRLTDAAGKPLARAESDGLGGDAALEFQSPADGTYRVEVRDLHGASGPRHVYRLRVVRPEADFSLALASDRFTLKPGKPLDVAVEVERRHGFSGEIELHAEGLPQGVSAAAVPAAAGSKTMTLRLTAGKGPAARAFRIVGKAKGKEAPARSAKARLPGFNAATTEIWLTVLPGP